MTSIHLKLRREQRRQGGKERKKERKVRKEREKIKKEKENKRKKEPDRYSSEVRWRQRKLAREGIRVERGEGLTDSTEVSVNLFSFPRRAGLWDGRWHFIRQRLLEAWLPEAGCGGL